MGREALCRCRWPGGEAPVKALLEGRELILRGGLRRSFALIDMTDVRPEGGSLCFSAGDEAFALELGEPMSRSWAIKILTPPPSLAKKLGVGSVCKARVIGSLDDPTLQVALAGSLAGEDDTAGLSLAVVASQVELDRALGVHAATLTGKPIWIVHGKGPHAAFGEGAVRRQMRAAGYMDTKVSAVSDTLSATRYSRR